MSMLPYFSNMTCYQFSSGISTISVKLSAMISRPGYWRIHASDGQANCALTLPAKGLEDKVRLHSQIIKTLNQ